MRTHMGVWLQANANMIAYECYCCQSVKDWSADAAHNPDACLCLLGSWQGGQESIQERVPQAAGGQSYPVQLCPCCLRQACPSQLLLL